MQEDDGTSIEKALFEDCRKNHFESMFNLWNNLTRSVDDYNKDCLKMANGITQSIANKLNLPVVNKWDVPSEQVTPYCGVAIFNRMAAVGGYNLTIGKDGQPPGFLQASFGNPIIQVKPPVGPDDLRKVIEGEISERRKHFLELKATAEGIDKSFRVLRDHLAITLEKQNLPGKCDYI